LQTITSERGERSGAAFQRAVPLFYEDNGTNPLQSIVRAALAEENGREVKHTGDGIMAAFLSAAWAIRCGIKMQQDLCQHHAGHPDLPLQVRIGIAAGEPIERNNDLFGSTVQLAARLCAHADPDSILISNAVAELCAGKALHIRSIGRITLKGFDEPLHLHRVEISSA
jgi:class 3 adenylate cyclase